MRACTRGFFTSPFITLRARAREALALLSALVIARSLNPSPGARLGDSEHLL